ncbi:MAG: hypothetical protein K6B68_04495 [Eubacterium sp.]|nr:hypothetical protein [Eubacterium sp.]
MNHKLRGFESLARMKDSDGNVISPAEFIPVAERLLCFYPRFYMGTSYGCGSCRRACY